MELAQAPSVEVFKTNITTQRQANAVLKSLHERFPRCRINFDLSDCDKILRIEGMLPSPDLIIGLVRSGGYECAVLE